MTPASMGWAIAVALVLPGLTGLLCLRAKLPPHASAAWSVAVSLAAAMAILLSGSGQDYWRSLWPREALDWLPGLAICLAALDSYRRPGQLGESLRWLGASVCMAAAFRLLYGSVYLRPGNLQWLTVSCIALWGGAMAYCWPATTTRSPAPTPKSERGYCVGLASMLGLSATAVGLSGSFTYGTVGLLLAASTLVSGLATGSGSAISSVLGLCILGLGHAFAELAPPATIAGGLALAAYTASRRLVKQRVCWSVRLVSILLMLTTCALVARQLAPELSAKPASHGYEAHVGNQPPPSL